MKLCKLTDQQGQTRGDTQWGPGVTHRAAGAQNQPLCSNGWIHAYEDLLVGVFMNPIHANIRNPRAWECEGEVGLRDGQLKCGCRSLTVTHEIEVPMVTMEHRVRFAIACAWTFGAPSWRKWAANWLDGEERAAAAWAEEAEAAAVDIVACAHWAVTDKPISALYARTGESE